MRIDLNAMALSQLPADRETRQVGGSRSSTGGVHSQGPTAVNAPSDDKATLSTVSLLRSSLAAAALATPAVRLDKVDAISQALRSGQYEINPSKIADAIVADRVG